MHGRDSKSLDECSPDEATILVAILALAMQLPQDMVRYTRAFGEVRSRYFHRDSVRKPYTPPPPNSSMRHTRPGFGKLA